MPTLWIQTFDSSLQPPPWSFQTPDRSTIIEATLGLAGFSLGFSGEVMSSSAHSIHIAELRALMRSVYFDTLTADFVARLSSGSSQPGFGAARVVALVAGVDGDDPVSTSTGTAIAGQTAPTLTLDDGATTSIAVAISGFGVVYPGASHNVESLVVDAGGLSSGNALSTIVTLSDASQHSGSGSVDVVAVGVGPSAAVQISSGIAISASDVAAGAVQTWTSRSATDVLSQATVVLNSFTITSLTSGDNELAWISLWVSPPTIVGNQLTYSVQGSAGPSGKFSISASVTVIVTTTSGASA